MVSPSRETYGLYVPLEDGPEHSWIRRGAAIIGSPMTTINEDATTDTGYLLRLDYEGGVYNPAMSWDEKIIHALDRHIVHYPTIARSIARADRIRQVGTLHVDEAGKLMHVEIHDRSALAWWRGA